MRNKKPNDYWFPVPSPLTPHCLRIKNLLSISLSAGPSVQCADRLMQRNNLTCQWKWVHIWLYILVTSFRIIHLMARRKPLSHLGVTNFLRVSLNLTIITLLIENQTTSSMYRLGTVNIVSPIIIFYTPGTAGCEGYLFSTAIHPRTFKFSILPGENINLINCF